MVNPKENIGLILKYLRQDRNLMQKEVCSFLHVTEQAYSNYETGKRTPNLSIIKQLATFYHIDIFFVSGYTMS